ncbi:MAG: hypothetical protein AAF851_05685 [Myxococcota bacterium]
MADPRTRIRRLHWAQEANYAENPGAGQLVAVPVENLGDLSDGAALIERNTVIGTIGEPPAMSGPRSAEFQVGLEVVGFQAAGIGDGVSPPAADYFDFAVGNIMAPPTSLGGEGGSVTGTTLTLDAAVTGLAAGALLYLRNTSSGEGRWAYVTAVSGTDVTLDRTLDITPDLVQGVRNWAPAEGLDGEPTLYAAYDRGGTNGDLYELPGLRATSASIAASGEAQALLNMTLMADDKIDSAIDRATLPDIQTGSTPTTPLRVARVFYNGQRLSGISEINVDFQLTAAARKDIGEFNLRSGHLVMDMHPTVQIQIPFEETYTALRRSAGVGSLTVQIGTGPASFALHIPTVQVTEDGPGDDGGRDMQSVTFRTKKGTAARRFVLGRA